MAFDIYSKRQMREGGAMPDVYQYENLPHEVRVQILFLCKRTIGSGRGDFRSETSFRIYSNICLALREEYGVLHLCGERDDLFAFDELESFFLNEQSIEKCLDVVQMVAKHMANRHGDDRKYDPAQALATLNLRLREASVGFRFEEGRIVKIADDFVHSAIIVPALQMLSAAEFRGANSEFTNALEFLKKGQHESAINESLKSFESVMKIICNMSGWIPAGDTASKLIETIFTNKLIPIYLQSHFSALQSVLKDGIPVVRNKDAAHGQGINSRNIPDYLAEFAIHQSASCIIFLCNAYQRRK